MKHNHHKHTRTLYLLLLAAVTLATGCKKYLDIPLPVNTIAGSAAYTSDNAAAAVLNGIYGRMATSSYFDGLNGIGMNSGLYTDELQNLSTLPTNNTTVFYNDAIQAAQTGQYWSFFYSAIYASNLVIEGVTPTSLNNKKQWLGEAYFLRAFLHFYLANLYGDVPIVTTSDYTTNQQLIRRPQADVYKQIIADLKQAQGFLTNDFRNTDAAITTDRGRPNRLAATALLARVYLYTGDWKNAGIQADTVIANAAFTLPAPAQAFLASSKESIWYLTPVNTYVRDYGNYNNGMPAVIPAGKTAASYVNVALSPQLLAAFETGDARSTAWARSSTTTATPAVTLYFPDKYKSNVAGAENTVLFRLAEQYLIRAEARAQLNNITGANSAQSDIDAVRSRAGLAGTTATTQSDMLKAIAHERQVELFTESGHRFFDLRRTAALDATMAVVSAAKHTTWSGFMQWWAIPTADIFANPGLKQTPGYQ